MSGATRRSQSELCLGFAASAVRRATEKTNPSDDLLDLLFVRFSLENTSNLLDRDVLPVSEGDDLVESCDEVEGVVEDGSFVRRGGTKEVGDGSSDEGEG